MLPGGPSEAARIQFTLESLGPYRVPLAGVFEPLIRISADGQVLTNPSYKLETLDAGVVRVDSTKRRLRGLMRGRADVRVTYLGATGTPDTVFSVQVVISRVAVDSALAFTELRDSTQLRAVALDANNAPVPNVPFTWSSADTTVAAVNDTGLVTAVDEGATTITAEADGVADSSDVRVTQVAAAVSIVPALDTLRTYETGAPAEDRQRYDDELPIWRTHRAVTIGVYCVAAATVAAGIVLRYTVYVEPAAGGGSVVVGTRW